MRTYLTIGIPRKPGNPSVILGPDKERHEHVDSFKRFQDKPASADLAEVQLWGSSEGIQKRQKLMTIQAWDADQKSKFDAKAKAKAKASNETETKTEPKKP